MDMWETCIKELHEKWLPDVYKRQLFEELGGKYERQGDYLIPCLTVPAEEEQDVYKRQLL